MITLKNISLLLVLSVAFSACNGKPKITNDCPTKAACLNDPNCKCWCSVQCDYRKKTADDNPVYVENDPNGKYCYCKQWDLDNYEDRCVLGKDIKQPEDAE